MLVWWMSFEPIQGGGVMPIRIRCLDKWPQGTSLIKMASIVAYFSGESVECYTGKKSKDRIFCGYI